MIPLYYYRQITPQRVRFFYVDSRSELTELTQIPGTRYNTRLGFYAKNVSAKELILRKHETVRLAEIP